MYGRPSILMCQLTCFYRSASFVAMGCHMAVTMPGKLFLGFIWLLVSRGDPCWWCATLTQGYHLSTQVNFSISGMQWRQCCHFSSWKLGLEMGPLWVWQWRASQSLTFQGLCTQCDLCSRFCFGCPIPFISPCFYPIVISFQQILALLLLGPFTCQ